MQVHTHFKEIACSGQDQLLCVLCSAAPRWSPQKQGMPQKDRNKQMELLPRNNSIPFSQLIGNPSSDTDEVPGWHPTQIQGTAMKRRETIPSVQSYILWNLLFSSKHVTLWIAFPPSSTPLDLNKHHYSKKQFAVTQPNFSPWPLLIVLLCRL